MSLVDTRPSADDGVRMSATVQDPREAGREEVRLCRRDPSRRMTSRLADLTAGPAGRVAIRLMALRVPRAARLGLAVLRAMSSGIGKKLSDNFEFFRGAIEEAGGWRAFRREFAVRLPVLCYHHVGEKLPRSWSLLTVSPRVFQQQIEWLVMQGYTGIRASDWLAWIKQGTPLPEKPVLVTFDDGYLDLLTNAIPTLETFGFKATIFFVSQHLGGASTWDEALGYPSRPIMTAKQMQECSSRGIEIGAHSRTHPDLRTLGNDELKVELEGSREDLSDLMGEPVKTFAYCFGRQNENVRKQAAAFYDLAFSCKPGLNAWRTDPHCLRRMFVHSNRLNFALQVKYGIDPYAVYCFAKDRVLQTLRRLLPSGRTVTTHPASTSAVTNSNS